ncbi:MAG: carboxypeptidase regulatory-like domain-containing protein [Candidatus Cloacimonetes bacterium]|nr:carboxypeptidase regulatory-like domain-containing protein [Candidatus Cloacimonadota bacterium]
MKKIILICILLIFHSFGYGLSNSILSANNQHDKNSTYLPPPQNLSAVGGYHESFDEDWATTGWVQVPADGNWQWSPGYAYLSWSPTVTNYDMSLISPEIILPDDPLEISDITISMFIDDYSSDTGELMEIWIMHDGGETMIFQWDLDINDDWGVSGGADFIYSDTSQFAGQTVQIKFRSSGGSTYNFNSWYIYDVLYEFTGVIPSYGALEGIVVDYYCEPIESVRVTANNVEYNPVYTNEDGYYTIDSMAVGLYDIQYFKDGYSEVWYYDVVIDSGNTTVQNAVLWDFIPQDIYAYLSPGDSSTHTVTIPNYSDEPIEWSASIQQSTKLKGKFLCNDFHREKNFSLTAETHQEQSSYKHKPSSDELWDILFCYDVDTPTGGVGIAGAEFGNGCFLVSEWGYSTRNVFKFDVDGN